MIATDCCCDVGSTTAEGACESVRLACQQLVQNTLVPTAADLQEEVQNQNSAEATWKAIMKAASNPMAFPNKQLTAYALFDGSRQDKPAGESAHGFLLGAWSSAFLLGTLWTHVLTSCVIWHTGDVPVVLQGL